MTQQPHHLPQALPVYEAQLQAKIGQPSAPPASAPAYASGGPSGSAAPSDRSRRQQFMSSLGWPRGLQDEILRSCEDFPVRHFVLDNSGSMSECDGHVPVSSGRHETFMECSRWTELLRSVSWLGNLAIGLEAHAEFRLINPTSGVAVANLGMS